jgi:hypothetical protein
MFGSESPWFVIYTDGSVFKSVPTRVAKSGYVYEKLDASDVSNVVVQLFGGDFKPFLSLETRYQVSEWTDQPASEIVLRRGTDRHIVEVYGARSDMKLDALKPFVTAYDRMRDFDMSKARAWVPSRIEVIVWDYEHSPEKPLAWPSGWPTLEDPTTIEKHSRYSIFLPFSELGRLDRFMRRLKERQAVLIDGKKFSIDYRIPLPHEDERLRAEALEQASHKHDGNGSAATH